MTSMNTVKLLLVVCLVHCTGCIWAEAVQPDKLKAHSDCEPLVGDDQTSVCLLNMNDREKVAIREALRIVTKLYKRDDFKQALIQHRKWIIDPMKPKETINGDRLYQDLNAIRLNHIQFVSAQPSAIPWSSTVALANPCLKKSATTGACAKGILISPRRIRRWYCDSRWCNSRASELKGKADLINTIAHELTHMVTTSRGKIKYMDDGWTKELKPNLVSYRVGYTVACFYLVDHKVYSSVDQCIKETM